MGDVERPFLTLKSSVISELAGLELLLEGLRLLGDVATVGYSVGEEDACFGWEGDSLKTWTVSVADDTQSSVDVELNAMLKMRAGRVPLRNWASFCASGIEKTRMTVPLSDAVASFDPLLSIAMQDSGAL